MTILALDTATRAGSVALVSTDTLLGSSSGDPERTHGERLPGDLLRLLSECGTRLDEVDIFAVCSGPGAFTGLRVGLATVQGFALATRRTVVAVPTLEALAHAGLERQPTGVHGRALVVPWMDAHRGEVFGAVYNVENDGVSTERRPAAVGPAQALLLEWAPILRRSPVFFVGDAVDRARGAITDVLGRDLTMVQSMPPLAPTVARLAHARGADAAEAPHAVRPVYIRRPDAEIARERHR